MRKSRCARLLWNGSESSYSRWILFFNFYFNNFDSQKAHAVNPNQPAALAASSSPPSTRSCHQRLPTARERLGQPGEPSGDAGKKEGEREGRREGRGSAAEIQRLRPFPVCGQRRLGRAGAEERQRRSGSGARPSPSRGSDPSAGMLPGLWPQQRAKRGSNADVVAVLASRKWEGSWA